MYQSMCNETIPDVAEKCPNGGATRVCPKFCVTTAKW